MLFLVLLACGLAAVQGDSACISRGGRCGDVSCCPYTNYVSGLCNGSNSRKCCMSAINCNWSNGSSGSSSSGTMTHSAAKSKISSCGIGIRASSGITDGNKCCSCTSLEGIRSKAITTACTFKRASGCSLTVTGGTEGCHAGGTYSHANGYKLDFGRSSCVDNYVKSNYRFSGYRGSHATYDAGNGVKYYLEGDHWDVLYQ